ncbi:MAG: MFS transporter, partial [Syntrophomonadaceae bacterium]|nr:MFS transporter [Syntrophomonadaceae bacterium]
IIGLLIFGLSVFSYSLVPSLFFLLLVRFIHGFGWGLSSTSASTVAADVIPKSRMGEGMGYYGLAGTLSMAVAPALGLYIISKFDFNILFLLATGMAGIAIVLAFTIKYREVSGKTLKFSLIEKAAIRPTLVIFFITMTYGSIVSFLALYGAQLGIANIGLFFTIYAVALAISRPFAGRMSDKVGFNVVVIPGILFIMSAMYILYCAVNIKWFLLAAVLYGIGFGAAQPSLQALAIVATPLERRGAANATFFTGFDLGIGISSIMWGVVAEAIGYSLMYLCAVIPALIGLIYYLATAFSKPAKE